MSIRQVVELVASEFPSVAQSKLRLLKTHGIVCLVCHTNNGCRVYPLTDVERIRYALCQQRDSYSPLAKTDQNLALLDCGEEPAPLEPITRIVVNDREVAMPKAKWVAACQIMGYTLISSETLEKIVVAKLAAPDLSGRFSVRVVVVVHAVMQLKTVGTESRNLHSAELAANSTVDLIDEVVGPAHAKNTAVSEDRARQDIHDLATTLASLIEALTVRGVEEISRHSKP